MLFLPLICYKLNKNIYGGYFFSRKAGRRFFFSIKKKEYFEYASEKIQKKWHEICIFLVR